MTTITTAAKPKFCQEPKWPVSFASNPPPTLVIRDFDQRETDERDNHAGDQGRDDLAGELQKGAEQMGTKEVTRQSPNTMPKASLCDAPRAIETLASRNNGTQKHETRSLYAEQSRTNRPPSARLNESAQARNKQSHADEERAVGTR